MKTLLRFFIITTVVCSTVQADGLMRPTEESYPTDFFRHRMTKIDVTLSGQISQTTVYQEFVNEWSKATDVVYSFPLPPDARATAVYFWSNDTMYRAVLKVKEQAVNPGTGEGGIDALVNAYLGPNGIRMHIPNVPAGEIQRVQIEFISLCNYHQGVTEYRYPLNTSDFVLYPVETFELNISVSSTQPINSSTLFPAMNETSKKPNSNTLLLSVNKSKMYFTSDFIFTYTSNYDSLKTDFYAIDNTSMDGHFVMLIKSPSGSGGNDVFKKNVVFVIDRSADMFGATLSEAKTAIGDCLKKLHSGDSFNIFAVDYSVTSWKPSLVSATSTAVDSAVEYVKGITFSNSSALFTALQNAINQFPSDTTQNIIVLFSDGKFSGDPEQLRSYNTKKAAIMTIAAASTAGRKRLEMIAYLNYGIPAFISQGDILKDKVLNIFDRINLPVLKDVHYEIGSNAHSILPAVAPSLYKGSLLYFTGRYKNPGSGTFSIAGFTPSGPEFHDIPLSFPVDTIINKFAEKFWAKEKIDEIERQILVHGENDSLKQADIDISLAYGIRCKYTAYIAEKTEPVTPGATSVETIEFTSALLESSSSGTILRWEISNSSFIKEFKIYRKAEGALDFTLIAELDGGFRYYNDTELKKGNCIYRIDAVTPGGKIYSITLDSRNQSPINFTLHNNYPNPFNPTTTISFAIPIKQHVILIVYDVTGREIGRLVDGQKEAGTYRAVFDSHSLPSGIYFYSIRTENFTQTKKMAVIK